jgi:hypothetical protein
LLAILGRPRPTVKPRSQKLGHLILFVGAALAASMNAANRIGYPSRGGVPVSAYGARRRIGDDGR